MSCRTLYNNQKNAIDTSINNDFMSGIHYHATGTGKSWIAMLILEKFNNKPSRGPPATFMIRTIEFHKREQY